MIRLLLSQMTLLCKSSCTVTQKHSAVNHLLLVLVFLDVWSQSHQFFVGYAMAGLPELPLGQDGLVRVGRCVLRAAQQDEEQEAGLLHCGQEHHTSLFVLNNQMVKVIISSISIGALV